MYSKYTKTFSKQPLYKYHLISTHTFPHTFCDVWKIKCFYLRFIESRSSRLKVMFDIDKFTPVAYMSSLPYLICWHYFVRNAAAILHLSTFILLFEVVLQEKCVCESEVIWTENPSLSRDWLKTSEIFELTRLSPLGLTATSHASFFIQSNEKKTSSYWVISSTFALKCY